MSWIGTPIEGGSDYTARAEQIVAEVTRGRSRGELSEELRARVDEAIAIVAAGFESAETGLVSEKLGAYSYTRANPITERDIPTLAIRALYGTGLTFRGL